MQSSGRMVPPPLKPDISRDENIDQNDIMRLKTEAQARRRQLASNSFTPARASSHPTSTMSTSASTHQNVERECGLPCTAYSETSPTPPSDMTTTTHDKPVLHIVRRNNLNGFERFKSSVLQVAGKSDHLYYPYLGLDLKMAVHPPLPLSSFQQLFDATTLQNSVATNTDEFSASATSNACLLPPTSCVPRDQQMRSESIKQENLTQPVITELPLAAEDTIIGCKNNTLLKDTNSEAASLMENIQDTSNSNVMSQVRPDEDLLAVLNVEDNKNLNETPAFSVKNDEIDLFLLNELTPLDNSETPLSTANKNYHNPSVLHSSISSPIKSMNIPKDIQSPNSLTPQHEKQEIQNNELPAVAQDLSDASPHNESNISDKNIPSDQIEPPQVDIQPPEKITSEVAKELITSPKCDVAAKEECDTHDTKKNEPEAFDTQALINGTPVTLNDLEDVFNSVGAVVDSPSCGIAQDKPLFVGRVEAMGGSSVKLPPESAMCSNASTLYESNPRSENEKNITQIQGKGFDHLPPSQVEASNDFGGTNNLLNDCFSMVMNDDESESLPKAPSSKPVTAGKSGNKGKKFPTPRATGNGKRGGRKANAQNTANNQKSAVPATYVNQLMPQPVLQPPPISHHVYREMAMNNPIQMAQQMATHQSSSRQSGAANENNLTTNGFVGGQHLVSSCENSKQQFSSYTMQQMLSFGVLKNVQDYISAGGAISPLNVQQKKIILENGCSLDATTENILSISYLKAMIQLINTRTDYLSDIDKNRIYAFLFSLQTRIAATDLPPLSTQETIMFHYMMSEVAGMIDVLQQSHDGQAGSLHSGETSTAADQQQPLVNVHHPHNLQRQQMMPPVGSVPNVHTHQITQNDPQSESGPYPKIIAMLNKRRADMISGVEPCSEYQPQNGCVHESNPANMNDQMTMAQQQSAPIANSCNKSQGYAPTSNLPNGGYSNNGPNNASFVHPQQQKQQLYRQTVAKKRQGPLPTNYHQSNHHDQLHSTERKRQIKKSSLSLYDKITQNKDIEEIPQYEIKKLQIERQLQDHTCKQEIDPQVKNPYSEAQLQQQRQALLQHKRQVYKPTTNASNVASINPPQYMQLQSQCVRPSGLNNMANTNNQQLMDLLTNRGVQQYDTSDCGANVNIAMNSANDCHLNPINPGYRVNSQNSHQLLVPMNIGSLQNQSNYPINILQFMPNTSAYDRTVQIQNALRDQYRNVVVDKNGNLIPVMLQVNQQPQMMVNRQQPNVLHQQQRPENNFVSSGVQGQSENNFPTVGMEQQQPKNIFPTVPMQQHPPNNFPTAHMQQQQQQSQSSFPTVQMQHQPPNNFPTAQMQQQQQQQSQSNFPTVPMQQQPSNNFPTVPIQQQLPNNFPTVPMQQQPSNNFPTAQIQQQPPNNFSTVSMQQQPPNNFPTVRMQQQTPNNFPTALMQQQSQSNFPTVPMQQQPPNNFSTAQMRQQHQNNISAAMMQQQPRNNFANAPMQRQTQENLPSSVLLQQLQNNISPSGMPQQHNFVPGGMLQQAGNNLITSEDQRANALSIKGIIQKELLTRNLGQYGQNTEQNNVFIPVVSNQDVEMWNAIQKEVLNQINQTLKGNSPERNPFNVLYRERKLNLELFMKARSIIISKDLSIINNLHLRPVQMTIASFFIEQTSRGMFIYPQNMLDAFSAFLQFLTASLLQCFIYSNDKSQLNIFLGDCNMMINTLIHMISVHIMLPNARAFFMLIFNKVKCWISNRCLELRFLVANNHADNPNGQQQIQQDILDLTLAWNQSSEEPECIKGPLHYLNSILPPIQPNSNALFVCYYMNVVTCIYACAVGPQ